MASNGSTPEAYVRIPRAELSQLRVRHLTSALDLSIALPEARAAACGDALTGYTEWVGQWQGAQVSIGWDWGWVGNEIIVLNPAEIRSNIQLLAADGSAESAALSRAHLHEWLESLPWRAGPIEDLIRAESQGAP